MKSLLILLAFAAAATSYGQVEIVEGKYVGEDGLVYTGKLDRRASDGSVTSSHQLVDGMLNGAVTFYHANGAIAELGSYKNGEKHGHWVQWNEEGSKTGEAHYEDGVKNGVWTIWDDNGVKRYHMVYANGQKVDVWKMWDEYANLISEKEHTP